jgi:hypothetical protein
MWNSRSEILFTKSPIKRAICFRYILWESTTSNAAALASRSAAEIHVSGRPILRWAPVPVRSEIPTSKLIIASNPIPEAPQKTGTSESGKSKIK